MFGVGILDKGKGVVEESSKGVENPAVSVGLHAIGLGSKGVLPSPKRVRVVMPEDHNSMGPVANNRGIFKFMPKSTLFSFDGKEPRAWL